MWAGLHPSAWTTLLTGPTEQDKATTGPAPRPSVPSRRQCGLGFPSCDFPTAAGRACTGLIWIKSKEFFFFFFSFAVLHADHQTTSFKPEPSTVKQKLGQDFLLFSFFSLGASVGCEAGIGFSSSPWDCPFPGQSSIFPTPITLRKPPAAPCET